MDQIGKCPIYVNQSQNTEIYSKTNGLVSNKISFNARKFSLNESRGIFSEGEVLNSRINIDIVDDQLQLSNFGISEDYLRQELLLPIRDVFVEKMRQHIELNFDVRAYRDNNHKWGNVDNVPTSMDLYFEHYSLSQIVLTFVVGDKGYMRTIWLYGDENFIPDFEQKQETIRQMYHDHCDYTDIQDYLSEQLDLNPQLLSWLFDDDGLYGKSPIALDLRRYKEFQKFRSSLEE